MTDRPPQNVAAAAPAYSPASRVEAQPLPAPSPPATVAAASAPTYTPAYAPVNSGGYNSNSQYSDVTGGSASSGQWTWNGGSPVTVGYGETVESIARKHGVPASAIMQTNGIREPGQIRPGQRLVIPRYVSAPSKSAPSYAAASHPKTDGNVHVVKAGETLNSISRHSGVSVAGLAKANHIDTSKKLTAGDRLTIPTGGHQVASAPPAAPKVAEPRTVPAEKKIKVASTAPVQTAHVAKEEPRTTESVVKTAEPSGAMPSFRWPVRGRVIAGFGSKSNGTQNDGINLAVPEGTPVKAAEDGVVAYAGNELKGYGNLVLIRHANGYVSAYAHAKELLVKRGDTIKRGQVIAHAGQTGNVTSPQLHFEIRKGSTPVDPTQFLGGA
ncbi:MAG TPA: peptidoglycan DD-metalloendopeptidase family protein [Pseudolabrys sp.]|nr:peptidoglycan DD-metalloendopeptidase family protein [Pseudolabrys sp.]